MATSSNVLQSLGHVQCLTGKETWHKWKSDTKILLEYHGSWDYINSDIPIPTDNAKLKEVDPLLCAAAYCISMTCNVTNCDAIDKIKDAKGKFDALKKLYKGNTPAQQMALWQQLYHIWHDPTTAVMEFINSVCIIVHELKAIKHSPKADEIRDIILMNLDPSFEVIQRMLTAEDKNGGQEWTIDSLGECLTAFENNHFVSSGSTSVEAAQVVRSRGYWKDGGERLLVDVRTILLVVTTVAVSPSFVALMHHLRLICVFRASDRGHIGHYPTGKGIHQSPSMDNWANTKGLDGVCNCCSCEGHIAHNCFQDMPEHIKKSSTPFLDNLSIASLHSILESSQTIILYLDIGYAYSRDNISKKIHYNSLGEFYTENFHTKGLISYGASGFMAPAT
ncbi:hypothetical protein CPB86DRAFT_802962 [Serendipita vermifera]|nr:hypothetical protein CPB86DRAFT_802962 [Serendipita vermifera]